MKRLLLFLPLSVTILLLQGQNYVSTVSDDSSRVIELKEITINSLQKTPQQRLVNYYRTNNAATLEEILSRLPEASILRRGPYGMETTIRSFSAGQINVLIDGMRIHGACTDKMDPATIYIEPVNLENLQVKTANAGFMSGSSIGGTVNMKIAEPEIDAAKKVAGVINSGYQSAAKSFYESAQVNYSESKWAFRISGTYRKSQNYRSGSGNIVRFSQIEKVNYSLSVKYQLNHTTFIKTDLLADDGWNIGYPALPMDVGFANARIGAISIIRENNGRKLNKWQVKLYANKIRHLMDDTKRPNVPIHMDMPGKSVTYGGYFDGEIKIKGKHRLQVIADASSTALKASMTMYQPGQLPMYMLTWPDNRKNQFGIATALSLLIDSSAKLQINARSDLVNYHLISEEAKNQVSIFGYSSAGRNDWLKNISAQLTKKINSRFRASASIGFSERAGTPSELFGFYLFNSSDGYDYIGNPWLKNEHSIQGEVSGTYSRKTNWLQLTVFYSHINNYIAGVINPGFSNMTIGANGVKSFENIRSATIAGAEISAVLKTINRTELVSTLRYNRGTDNNKQPLPYISPFKNVTSVRYQAGSFTAQLESEAATPQKRVSVKTGEDATTGYMLIHIRLGYLFTFLQKKVHIQSGIENLFDKEYHDHLDWGNISRPGRNIYLQLKLIF